MSTACVDPEDLVDVKLLNPLTSRAPVRLGFQINFCGRLFPNLLMDANYAIAS